MKKIIYIGGIGHSGSTILDVMLSRAHNVFGLGQIATLPHDLNKRCSCGETLRACPVWGKILSQLTAAQLTKWRELNSLIKGEKNFLRFVGLGKISHEYAAMNDILLQTIFEVTGAEVLIDSSKNLSRAVSVLRKSKYDTYFIHLIRDSRGFVNGMNKVRRKRGQKPHYVDPMVRWVIKNALASSLFKRLAGDRYLRVAFEELILEPRKSLERIGDFVNFDFSVALSSIEHQEAFRSVHIPSGNPWVRSEGLRNDGSIEFAPSVIESNRLRGLDDRIFWYCGGWLAAFWGYDKRQSYLQRASVTGKSTR